MEWTNKTLLLLVVFLVVSQETIAAKTVDCTVHVFAPPCRGSMQKRKLQKLEPLFEQPRTPRYNPNDEVYINSNPYPVSHGSKDNSLYDKVLLETLFEKLAPKNTDYDTETCC